MLSYTIKSVSDDTLLTLISYDRHWRLITFLAIYETFILLMNDFIAFQHGPGVYILN